MKKILCLLLSLALLLGCVFALSACGKREEQESSDGDTSTPEDSNTPEDSTSDEFGDNDAPFPSLKAV